MGRLSCGGHARHRGSRPRTVVYPRVMLQRAGIAEVEVLAAIMAVVFDQTTPV